MGFFDFWLLPRVWIGAVFCMMGLGFLMKSWITRNVRLLFLTLIFFTFCIVTLLPLGSFAKGMGMHPSPMCIVEKPFVFIQAGRAVPVIFLSLLGSVLLLSIIGNKLFCGWVCFLGALQEIVHRIPLSDKFKVKLPFKLTNGVRIVIFILFIIILFAGERSIYPYINSFEFFHWGFEIIAVIILSLTLIAALFIFRPFCYLICPLGLVTWVFEHIAIFKVKLDKEKCTDCKICLNKTPCPVVPYILEEKKVRPDCHPCGRCIEVCPEKALKYRL